MIEHLSYSSISSYLACPKAWKFHYVDQVAVPTAAAMVFGKALHGVIEEHIKLCNATKSTTLVERWSWNWEKAVTESGEIAYGEETPETLFNQGVTMLSHPDIKKTLDDIRPAYLGDKPRIEEYIELRVPGVPVPVIGYIDVITVDGVPGDFKTANRRWSDDRASDELQPAFYLAALSQSGYKDNPGRKFRHYVFVKTKTPQVQVIETTRAAGELLWVLELARNVWKSIEINCFPPNPSTWKCNQKWCEYWSLCRGRY